jgi:hypothetical protein
MSVIRANFKEQKNKTKLEIQSELIDCFYNGFFDDFFDFCERFYILSESISNIDDDAKVPDSLRDETYLDIATFSHYEYSTFIKLLFNFIPAFLEELDCENFDETKNEIIKKVNVLSEKHSKMYLEKYTLIDNVEDIIEESKKLSFESIHFTSFLYNNFILSIKNNTLKAYINNECWGVFLRILKRYESIAVWDKGIILSKKNLITLKKSYIEFDYTIRIPFSTKVYFWFKFGGLPLLNKISKRDKLLKLFGYSIPPQ